MKSLVFIVLVAFTAGLAGSHAAESGAVSPEPRPRLTDYRSFWGLDDASRHREHDVRFEADVLFYDPVWRVMWLENEGVPLFCHAPNTVFDVHAGQRVLLECRVLPTRGFEPMDLRLTVIGTAPHREVPIIIGHPELAERHHENMVTLAGVVEAESEVDPLHVRLSFSADGVSVQATVIVDPGAPIPEYVGQIVEATGLIFVRKNADGTINSEDLWIAGFGATRALYPLSRDPAFEREPMSGERLRGRPQGEVVLVRGEVRSTEAGRSVVIWDESNQVIVLSAQTTKLQPGDLVEAIGRLRSRGPEIFLEQGLWRRQNLNRVPEEGARFKLRRISQVLELGLDEARRGHNAELWGVVTWSDPQASFFYIQDSTSGVCVHNSGPWTLQPPLLGSSVKVTGRTGAGEFAPQVEFINYATEGSMQLPEPRPITLDQLQSGAEEARRLELRGYLREVRKDGPWTELLLTTPTGEFTGRLITSEPLGDLVGAVLRLRGVCMAQANTRGELTGIRILVANRREIAVEEAAQADPFAGTVVPMSSLRRFSPLQTPYRRVRLVGTVTLVDSGQRLVLQEGSMGVEVLTRDTGALRPGDTAEVVGFPGWKGGRVVLRESLIRPVQQHSTVTPQDLAAEPGLEEALDNQLVRCTAVVENVTHANDALELMLKLGNVRSAAQLKAPVAVQPALEIGSTLSCVGVYRIEYDVTGRPDSFRLQLRSPGDIVVVRHPPWFTFSRALGVVGLLFCSVAAALLWVGLLRRRVRGQTRQIREQLEHQAKLELELQRAAKLESLSLLAGGIAHDFNNLLTVVMGNITLAMLEEQAMTAAGDCLRNAERGAQRARDLTQQLLTFAKGGDPLRSAEILPEIVREAAEFVLRGSSVRCDYEFEAGLWPAEVDRGQIGQVVHNLVLNAMQAMPQGGAVRVQARNRVVVDGDYAGLAAGNYILLTIADSGPGMAPDVLGHLFDPYFTTKKGGSGLGLATVHSIIRRHRGKIGVRSEVGYGTVFQIFLPAAQIRPTDSNPTGLPKVVARGLNGRVLVMDDEEDIRRLVTQLLRRMGLESVAVPDGAAAIQAYREAREKGRPFDLVIMDLTVPGGMGGREAMETLRRFDPNIRAIVSSGYSNDPIMAHYCEYGFSGIVEKPYEVENLMNSISRVLAGPKNASANVGAS